MQGELFSGKRKGGYEVHTHSFISGPRSRFAGTDYSQLTHSHEGGDERHQHPDTGPASYTIDKDEWLRATGLRGGGRKKFTSKPTGPQLPIRALEKWQTEFEVIVCDPPETYKGQGAGIAPIARMILACGMTPTFTDRQTTEGRHRAAAHVDEDYMAALEWPVATTTAA